MELSREKKVLKKQLGRKPRNIVKAPVKCKVGYPQVITTAPILEDSIFPTTFWLTCPELNYRIAQLEDQGYVTKIKEEIDSSIDLKKQLMEAHQTYADYRVSLMTEKKLAELKDKNEGQYKVIKESGVGGIMDYEGIKCLHTHYAHYLARGDNPVGLLVQELLNAEYDEFNPDECRRKCELEVQK
ncbi:MAG: DUF501 domain-containing protein [Halanaerobacter sp.]